MATDEVVCSVVYANSLSSVQYGGIEIYFPPGTYFGLEVLKLFHTQFPVPKCFNTSILYSTDAHFYNPSVKIGSISFSPSSNTQPPPSFRMSRY